MMRRSRVRGTIRGMSINAYDDGEGIVDAAEAAAEVEAAARDCEQSLVAALQESDTAVEALNDGVNDARSGEEVATWRARAGRHPLRVSLAGLMLAAIGLLFAARRRR